MNCIERSAEQLIYHDPNYSPPKQCERGVSEWPLKLVLATTFLIVGISLFFSIGNGTTIIEWLMILGCFGLVAVLIWQAWKDYPDRNWSYTIIIDKVKKEVTIQGKIRKRNWTLNIDVPNELQSIEVDDQPIPCYGLRAILKNTEAMTSFPLPSLELCNEILAEIRQLMPQEHLILENSTDT